jgi:hypothetical protein
MKQKIFMFLCMLALAHSACQNNKDWQTYQSTSCPIEFTFPNNSHVRTNTEPWRAELCSVDVIWDHPKNEYSANVLRLMVLREGFEQETEGWGFEKNDQGRWVVSRPLGPKPEFAKESVINGYKVLEGNVGVGTSPQTGKPIGSQYRIILSQGNYSILLDPHYIISDENFQRVVHSIKLKAK